jgi:ubiquinone/menaquinone biosynthesis C-methylase UbiE
MRKKPTGAGKSSFDLIDAEELFNSLPISGKTGFLDVACGNGAYSLALSERVDKEAVIYAVDLWEDGIMELEAAFRVREIYNIRAVLADISKKTPLSDESVDLCLMASVLHDLIEDNSAEDGLNEIVRVMKPKGDLAVVEFKKIEGPPGPPIHIRITPEQVAEKVSPHGFSHIETREVGPYHYLSRFILEKR